MYHCMLDLETWGTRAGCGIRSIGAVVFDPKTGLFGSEFYINVCDRSLAEFGLVKDQRTVDWWADQSAAAQVALLVDPQPVDEALTAFTNWWRDNALQFVWGHGASFDPVITEAAMERCGLEVPWKFWDVRCCRTILAAGARKPERFAADAHHNALDDAKAQARAVSAVFRNNYFEPN